MAASVASRLRPAAKYGLLGLGWGGLLLLDPLNQILDRESPAAAASHWRREQQHGDRRGAPLQPPPPLLSPANLATLRAEGWVVLENSLGDEALAAARSDCTALNAKGTLDATLQSKSTRTDAVTWLAERHSADTGADADAGGQAGAGEPQERGAKKKRDLHPVGSGLRTALRRVRSVAVELCPADGGAGSSGDMLGSDGRQVQLGVPLSGQLARYGTAGPTDPPRYIAHRDGYPGGGSRSGLETLFRGIAKGDLEQAVALNSREYTVILYLSSPDPKTGWGGSAQVYDASGSPITTPGPAPQTPAPAGDRRGSLVLHLGADDDDTTGETATRLVHVEPIAGRMIIFDARTVLHEVLPHDRPADRLALTVWVGGQHSSVAYGLLPTAGLRRVRGYVRSAMPAFGGGENSTKAEEGKSSTLQGSIENIDWKSIDFV